MQEKHLTYFSSADVKFHRQIRTKLAFHTL